MPFTIKTDTETGYFFRYYSKYPLSFPRFDHRFTAMIQHSLFPLPSNEDRNNAIVTFAKTDPKSFFANEEWASLLSQLSDYQLLEVVASSKEAVEAILTPKFTSLNDRVEKCATTLESNEDAQKALDQYYKYRGEIEGRAFRSYMRYVP